MELQIEKVLSLGLVRREHTSREWMAQINEFGEFLYATDAHMLIRIRKSLSDVSYPAHKDTANFTRIFEPLAIHKPVTITVQELQLALARIEKVPGTKCCSECHGEGEVKCDYGHMHDCVECKGEGDVEDYTQPDTVPRTGKVIKYKGAYVSPYYLDKLLQIMMIENIIYCEQYAGLGHDRKVQYFHVGEYEVLIMPMLYDSDGSEWEDWDVIDFETGKIIKHDQ